MKVQNTITQPQLEMLLRLANAMHSGNPAWRYGQSVFNALQTILPDLAEEVRGKSDIDPYSWPEDHGARWTQWYAAVCPDPQREEDDIEEEKEFNRCLSLAEEQQEMLDFTASFTKKHK